MSINTYTPVGLQVLPLRSFNIRVLYENEVCLAASGGWCEWRGVAEGEELQRRRRMRGAAVGGQGAGVVLVVADQGDSCSYRRVERVLVRQLKCKKGLLQCFYM